jgi:hypothetical protein
MYEPASIFILHDSDLFFYRFMSSKSKRLKLLNSKRKTTGQEVD